MPKFFRLNFQNLLASCFVGFSLLFGGTLLAVPGAVQAQTVVTGCPPGANQSACEACEGSGGNWTGTACETPGQRPLFGAGSVFVNVVNILLFIVGALSVVMLIIGGIRYVVSGGDQNAVAGAKNTIIYAIIGVVVAFFAWGLVNFVITNLAR